MKKNNKKYSLIRYAKFPLLFVIIIWAIKLIEISFEISLVDYGVLPRKLSGIKGVLFSPFIHKDIKHLLNNSIPILILGSSLCYFYKKTYKTIFPLLFLLSGIFLWCLGRANLHIGASGIIYAMASFIFFSGVISKNKNLAALSLIVIFIYGGLFWGLFPTHQEISWEGHLSGFISGMFLSWSFKGELPERKKYQWEIDEEIEAQQKINMEKAIKKKMEITKENLIKYVYKKK